MKISTSPIIVSGVIEESNRLLLDDPIALKSNTRVSIYIVPEDDDVSEIEWMRWLAANPAYDFLKDEEEDIYTLTDGKPIDVER